MAGGRSFQYHFACLRFVYYQCITVCMSILWFTSACAIGLWKWQLVNSNSAGLKAHSMCSSSSSRSSSNSSSRTVKFPHKQSVSSSHSGSHHYLQVLRFLQYWSLLYKPIIKRETSILEKATYLNNLKYITKYRSNNQTAGRTLSHVNTSG